MVKSNVAVKKLNSLLRTGNDCSKKYCLNCFKSFRPKLRLETRQIKC